MRATCSITRAPISRPYCRHDRIAALIKACLTSAAAHSQHGKEKGAATKTAPRGRAALNRKHRDDSVTAIDDDDLVVDNEVHVSTPFRVDLDQGGGHRDNAYARRYCRPNADVEVDVGGARTLGDHGVADRRALLSGQRLRALSTLSLAL